MTLTLLLARKRPDGNVVVLATPEGGSIEPLLAALPSQLGPLRRLVFPLPDHITRRHTVPPALIRKRHADLWHALTADERSRTVMVLGPTAAYLAPVLGPDVTTFVAILDSPARRTPAGGGWQAVVGPCPELDGLPEDPRSDDEREGWLERVRDATGRMQLVSVANLADITGEVAAAAGVPPKGSLRVARRAAALADAVPDDSRADRAVPDWPDAAIRSLSRQPRLPRSRERPGQRA